MHFAPQCQYQRPRLKQVWRKAILRTCLAVLHLGVALAPLAYSAERAVPEHQAKAMFILNFSRFVEWPPEAFRSPDAPIVIGVLGEDVFLSALTRVTEHQQVRGRGVLVRSLAATEHPESCHVVFVSRALQDRAEHLLKRIQGRPILTVGDGDRFPQMGGMIGFVVVHDRLRFDINSMATAGARLELSSKLLAVARAIVKQP